MKIVGSDFKDFYDGCAVQTPDEKPIYVRKLRSVIVDNNGTPEDLEVCRILKPYVELFNLIPNGYDVFGPVGLLGFCGKLYPHWDKHFELDSLLKAVADQPVERSPRLGGWSKARRESFYDSPASKGRGRLWQRARFTQADLKVFVENFKTDIGDEPFVQLKIPVFHITSARKSYRTTIDLNPCLEDIGFQRLLKPFTTYQELDMYLGNNLATQMDPEAKGMTDELKADAHGFDKWSFRTHKEDSTKAKKKEKKKQEAAEKKEVEGIQDEVRKLLED